MKRFITVILAVFFNTSLMASLPTSVNGERLPSLAPMLKQVMPAVVNIATRGKKEVPNTLLQNPLIQRFFQLPNIRQEKITNSLGSGIIVDAHNGYILTNSHVIEGAFEITVTLADGRELYAEVIGRDPETDVAVIKIKPGGLQQLHFADSSQLQVGDFVVAIGNPFGLGQTATSGIVSALGRSGLGIESYEDFIQTDASINLGSSGGALVNLRGELVGINTAILGSGNNNNGNIGIAFAIPINMASNIMQQLIDFGEVKRGRLGVQIQDLSPALAEALAIKKTQQGVVVTQVEIKSSAFEAGLKVADVIIEANGKAIKTTSDIHNLVGLLQINQHVQLKVLRQAKPVWLSIKIQEEQLPSLLGQQLHPRLHGAVFVESGKLDLTQGQFSQLFIASVDKGSPAWLLGFREGDEIVGINRQRAQYLNELKYAFNTIHGTVLLSIKRGNLALHLQFDNS